MTFPDNELTNEQKYRKIQSIFNPSGKPFEDTDNIKENH